ncbi:M28 family peptidase [Parabacteroides sp. PF5-6]|uniref:M28 family peptidase n=1 Tax=Parabacteroides sp. PF5-6 TaxID=1742403 RepID=UPI002406C4B0|nr:M28 family peptidase [Parabacteroides sp. PF5-6]MDF9829572.1 Zn-dependent M28 family amino/carboxypeptidase [Parabacteroides sp. PF5-6]
MKTPLAYLLPGLLSLLVACSHLSDKNAEVSVDNLKRICSTLGSDAFMGRKPFTAGEALTLNYLQEELQKIGYAPGFGDSYLQEVPVLEATSRVKGACTIALGNETIVFDAPDEIAIHAPYPAEQITIEASELVFCGFGIEAAEYGWNDFEGMDLKGKTLVVFINDPGLYTGDPSLFKGEEMTYYGRWTYKFEKAAELGAEGILIIHEETGAGYGYNVPRNSAISSHLYIDDATVWDRCKLAGWISAAAAERLFNRLGYDIEELRRQSARRAVNAFPMQASISVTLENTVVRNVSHNVAGIWKGSVRPEEAIVVAGHWDHFGIGEASRGDSIFNGAVDNATVIAWAFEIGRLIKESQIKPERSLILFFPTAEEQGLIGSAYYTAHPIVPMSQTVACFNNDIMIPRGAMNDLTIIGYGHSQLDSLFGIYADKQGRYILPDPEPESGLFFRSDHYSFYKAGVASSWALGCYDSQTHGKEWAEKTYNDFVRNVYHTPHDNYDPTWDWSGVVQDIELTCELIRYLSRADSPYPKLYK